MNAVAKRFSFIVRYSLLALSAILCILSFVAPGKSISSIASFIAVILCVYAIYISRKNWALVVIFAYMFICYWSIFVTFYTGLSVDSPFLRFKETAVANNGASIMLLFILIVVSFLPIHIERFPSKNLIINPRRENDVAVIVLVICTLLFGLLGLSSGTTNRDLISPLYEYSIIFIILALFFSGEKKVNLILICFAVLVRAFIDLSSGNRVTTLEMLIIVFLMMLAWKTRWRVVVPIAIGLFICMLTVGTLRGDNFSFDAIASSLASYIQNGFAWEGAYAAYHASLVLCLTKDILGVFNDVSGMISYIFSQIFIDPDGFVSPLALRREYYWQAAGLYFPFIFYYYLDLPGVVIFSALVALVIRFLGKSGSNGHLNNVQLLIIVWVSSTCVRWFSYEITPLLRGLLFVLIIYAIIYLLTRNRRNSLSKIPMQGRN